jgi:hypothetical protein
MGQDIFQVLLLYPVSTIQPMFNTHFHLHVPLTATSGQTGNLKKKKKIFPKSEINGYKISFNFYVLNDYAVSHRPLTTGAQVRSQASKRSQNTVA